MADYYVQFCVALPAKTAKQKAFWKKAKAQREKDVDSDDDAILDRGTCAIDMEGSDAYLCDDGGSGGVDYAIDVIQKYLQTLDPKGAVELTWANTCSKSRPDSFSGGGARITATTVLTTDDDALLGRAAREILAKVNLDKVSNDKLYDAMVDLKKLTQP